MSETTRQFLKKIEEVLISNPKGLTLDTISDIVGEDGDRVKMYLDFLEISEKIEIKLVGDFQLYVHLQHSVARYDATEYIETERKLQESEERIKLALRGAALGTWDWDAKSNLTTFNERYAEILGYTVDELDSTYEGWLQTLHPDDREQARKEWEDARDGEAVFYSSEHRMLTKSGGWRWVLSSGGGVEYDEEGHILRASGTIMDITDRKTIEQNLQMSENSYRVLFSESPIP